MTLWRRAAAQVEVVPSSGALDELLFSEGDVWRYPRAEQERLRTELIRATFIDQVSRCPDYRAFVRRRLGAERDLEAVALAEIPVIPTSAFKTSRLLSVGSDEVAKWCSSSGTQGLRSTVGRDQATLERLLGSVRAGITLLRDLYEHETRVLNLGPERAEAGDVWFPYVLSLIELLYPTGFYVRQQRLMVDEVAAELSQLQDEVEHTIICGAPFFVFDLLCHLRDTSQRWAFADRLTIVTAGGWKRRADEAVDRALLTEMAGERLGLSLPSQVRDAFNQVELNTVFFECEQGRKHVPPWVAVLVRSPDDLRVLPPGEAGLLSFLDASASSYPAFIVGDDLGTVHGETCACGREGVTVAFHRRVSRRDARGCALSLAAQLPREGIGA